jgi:hypothetical protein
LFELRRPKDTAARRFYLDIETSIQHQFGRFLDSGRDRVAMQNNIA